MIEKIIWRIRYSKDEWFPLVDEEGNVIGSAPRSICHNGRSFLLHPVVHLHVISTDGRLLLQRRKLTKRIQPGKWDTAVGGHVSYGEEIEQALQREVEEEIGLKKFKPRFIARYVWKSDVERELVNTFYAVSDGPFKFLESEIEEIRFWSPQELSEADRDIFTPNFLYEYETFIRDLKV